MSAPGRFVRTEYAVAISTEHGLAVSTPGAVPTAVPGLEGNVASRLWERLASPATADELAEASGLDAPAVRAVVDALLEAGVAAPADGSDPGGPESSAVASDTRTCNRMVLGVCGCAQAIFTPDLVRLLLSAFTRELDVVLTSSAGQLTSERALTLLGARVWRDLWQAAPPSSAPHIDLARTAEMVLVLPASARSLHALGHATCEDLLSLVVTATRAPVVVVPSMNPAMWSNPTVRDNADQCRRAGMTLVEPGFARSVADGPEKRVVGGVGVGPFTPGIVSLLSYLTKGDRGT